jgi:ABC-type molybdate transport system substrate-binding protein
MRLVVHPHQIGESPLCVFPILQSGALVSSGRHAAATRRFLEFLTGPEGRKILQSNGLFLPPSSHPDQ